MTSPSMSRSLLVIIAVLIGLIVALIAGILSSKDGASPAAASIRGAVAFAGTVTLMLLILNALGAL
ncbi:hypothetical protein GCM10009765_63510 [Fodinicola feengrottensis]|uniref:Uncharacterized protein n=1 Tax=Fodinicola feengrottensis TaxID=435914 RepID=A0ABN2IIK1_9ACTN